MKNGNIILSAVIAQWRSNSQRNDDELRVSNKLEEYPEWILMLYEAAGYDRIHRIAPYMMVLDMYCGVEYDDVDKLIERIHPPWQRIYDELGWGKMDIDYDVDNDTIVLLPCPIHGLDHQYNMDQQYGDGGDGTEDGHNIPLLNKVDALNQYALLLSVSAVQGMLGTTLPVIYDGKSGLYKYTGSDANVIKIYGNNPVWESKDGYHVARICGYADQLINTLKLWAEQQTSSART